MSELDELLTKTEPLERHEIRMLQDWLRALQQDCELFGEAAEDTQRMNAIRRRINKEGVSL